MKFKVFNRSKFQYFLVHLPNIMNDMEQLSKYFSNLTKKQSVQFAEMEALYADWNAKINVISRKDFEHFYERHVLHSLAIAKIISFRAGTEILDIGTGGGFPGVPLAILFPDVKFVLIDSIGKKIKVVSDVVEKLGLKNVIAIHTRAEQLNMSFDFVVSRAVTDLPTFMTWVGYKIRSKGFNDLRNGVIYLKGGDIKEELKLTKKHFKIFAISDFFTESFFETKFVVHLY